MESSYILHSQLLCLALLTCSIYGHMKLFLCYQFNQVFVATNCLVFHHNLIIVNYCTSY